MIWELTHEGSDADIREDKYKIRAIEEPVEFAKFKAITPHVSAFSTPYIVFKQTCLPDEVVEGNSCVGGKTEFILSPGFLTELK